jgi:hypothetical protein
MSPISRSHFYKLVAGLFAALLLALSPACHAGGFEAAADPLARMQQEQIDRMSAMVGKRLFMYPSHESACRVSPITAVLPKLGASPPAYRSDKPIGMTVEALEEQPETAGKVYARRFYKIHLDDGISGYVSADLMRVSNDARDSESAFGFSCFATFDPEVRATALAEIEKAEADRKQARADRLAQLDAEQKAADEKAEALKKKPGARIGMTAKQVREATSWGGPESINRTVTAGHVHEQWVYATGSYLYFDDGRLTAVQN